MSLMNLENMIKPKTVIFILGPTAIGKTTLSINIAKKLNTEIISCDSRQFYKELLIGAAPPNFQELSEIKHHFIHHLSVKNDYNAGDFEIDGINKITELHKKYNTIVSVGGSGLYINAICKGFDKIPKASTDLRDILNNEFNQKGIIWLQKEVKKIDPIFFNTCDINNPQRLLRALEVYKSTGKKISSLRSETKKIRPFKIIKIGLEIPRLLLYERINNRVDKMIKDGLLEEVKSLLHFQNKNALQTVGYRELFEFYNHNCSLEEAISNIKQNTRKLAKRQLTWFKRDKDIKWFNPNETKKINAFISKL